MKRGGIPTPSEAQRALRRTVALSIGVAALAVCALTITGHTRAGVALAAGLLLGSLNGAWAQRTLGSEISFRAASLGRLGVLSALGLATGFALGTDVVWLPLAGLALAQLVLAGSALKEMLHHR